MKKTRLLSLVAILLTSLVAGTTTACTRNNNETPSNGGNNTNVNPSIDNVADEFLEIANGGYYDPFAFVVAYDPQEGDITKKVEVTIDDNITGQTVEKIYLNTPGEYTVTYYVEDEDGNMDLKTCVVTVGDPYAEEKPNTCKATGYKYDINNLTYNLSWSEEFNYVGGVDQSIWTHEIGNGNYGWGNGELQYYTNNEKNIAVDGNNLRITLLKEKMGSKNYTSARIISRNKKTFKYGKFEARIKMPQGKGTWPAFWLLSSNGSWPAGGEIDIVEAVGYRPNLAFGTAHSQDRNGMNNTGRGDYLEVPTMYDDYHIYGVEWLPDGLRFYVDDTIYYEYFPGHQFECPTKDMWPFSDSSFYIILNLAYGGEWGGAQGVDDTIFTKYDVSMYVDYVRVYEAEEIKAFK